MSAEVSNLLHARSIPSQVMGWETLGKEEKLAHGPHWATRNTLPHPALSPNPVSHRFETPEENMAGPSKSNPIPHRELGFNISLIAILDLASK